MSEQQQNFFAELQSKGADGLRSGLRKVTESEKVHKNPELKAESAKLQAENNERLAKLNVKPKVRLTKPCGEPAAFEVYAGAHVYENFGGSADGPCILTVAEGGEHGVKANTNYVTIRNCELTVFEVKKGDVKNFVFDNCKKIEVNFDSESYKEGTIIEVFNSQSINFNVPANPPTLTTTLSSDIRLSLPNDIELVKKATMIRCASSQISVEYQNEDYDMISAIMPPYTTAEYRANENSLWHIEGNTKFL